MLHGGFMLLSTTKLEVDMFRSRSACSIMVLQEALATDRLLLTVSIDVTLFLLLAALKV